MVKLSKKDLKIDIHRNKRPTSDTFFATKVKSLTMKSFTCTIYSKDRKCRTETLNERRFHSEFQFRVKSQCKFHSGSSAKSGIKVELTQSGMSCNSFWIRVNKYNSINRNDMSLIWIV